MRVNDSGPPARQRQQDDAQDRSDFSQGNLAASWSITTERGYKDAHGKWQSTNSIDTPDLQNNRKALDLAHNDILKLETADREIQRERDELEAGVGA